MSFHSFIEFIKYRSKAKTRHGIHSPFVYAFIDNCLGKQSSLSLEQRINEYFGDVIKWDDEGFSIIPSKLFIFAMKDIHATSQNTANWDDLRIMMPGVSISIDLFSIGLLVFNPEIKEKQHFVLKYPL